MGGSCSGRCMQCHILRYALYDAKMRAMPPKMEATTMAAVLGCDILIAESRTRRGVTLVESVCGRVSRSR